MKTPPREPPSPQAKNYERMEIKELFLDPKNPRLLQYGIKQKATQDEILQALWDRLAVDEVAMSIAADGYWDFEPLFVVKEKIVVPVKEGESPPKDGKPKEEIADVVIEGNRRLAAVKLLLSSKLRRDFGATDLPEVSKSIEKALKSLPIIRVDHRQDVWRFLGFKHVNGPAKWGSYCSRAT
jgi:hypothetical protein